MFDCYYYCSFYYFVIVQYLCVLWLQSSNRVIGFSLNQTEKTVLGVIDLTVPLVIKLENPINKIDDIMCKSLDIVEENLPIITYTPEEVSGVVT